MPSIGLYVTVPIASFRAPQAREYLETLPCPPPSTVYGMLLSLVGEPDRLQHRGAEIAVALLSEPARSVVLRTAWRIKDRKLQPGVGNNRRPDFQEVLTGLVLGVWVRRGKAEAAPVSLAERVDQALRDPESVERYGGLSLGESTYLVDEVSPVFPPPWNGPKPPAVRWLVEDARGTLALPIWADHVSSAKTRWGQFRLETGPWASEPPAQAWVAVSPA